MYVPFLNGRAEEMLALTEIRASLAAHGRVVPLIEPVKLGDRLHKKLELLRAAGAKSMVIANPTRGDLSTPAQQASAVAFLAPDLADVARVRAVFRESASQGRAELRTFLATYVGPVGVVLTTNLITESDLATEVAGRDFIVFFTPSMDASKFATLIPRNRTINVVQNFRVRAPNKEYVGVSDEAYSDDLTKWKASGLAGFADYTVLGTTYAEGGSGAVALAIHMTFMAGTALRVQHFASDAGARGDNPPKWLALLKELEDTIAANPSRFDTTAGLAKFRTQYAARDFTSPASSKRQQIMHHLQTVAARMTI